MNRRHAILEAVLQGIRPKEIPQEQQAAMNRFKQELREFLQAKFPLGDALVGNPFETGSTQKGTDIALKYDLDIVLPFRHGFAQGPPGMRKAVQDVLEKYGANRSIEVRSQRFSIRMSQMYGSQSLEIDVVPAMEKQADTYKKTAKEEDKYLILYNQVTGKPHTTNVHRQEHLIKEHLRHYRDMVRLLKAWRFHQTNGHPISSYALELMVYAAATAPKAPKTGPHDKLLLYVLNHCTEQLLADWELQDIGANYPWKDFLKPGAKTQLAGLWRKLTRVLEAGDEEGIRQAFGG